jgi:predicted DNA-binding transcriptional regulator YafY
MPTRLERIIAIKAEIDRGRHPTVVKLCEMFEIKQRTLHEDLRLMREQMGMDIKYDRFKDGYYNARPGQELPTFDLSTGEVFALTLAKDILIEYTGTPFLPILQGALEKIRERLPQNVRVDMKDIAAAVDFGKMPSAVFSRKMFMDIHSACDKHLKVKIEYLSAYKGEHTERTIHAYRLLNHQNSWYVVAFCELRQDKRLFALHRIKHYEITDLTFPAVDVAQLEEWLNSPFFIEHREKELEVTIRFGAISSRYIKERHWHPSQSIEDNLDGGCTMSFKTTSLDEVKRWVLAYGCDAEVLKPDSLRQSVVTELESSLEKYTRSCPKAT